jgi:multimeric flavodoxin WrbA
MACIFKSEECKIQDDWHIFKEKFEESDAIIIGAPTYLLGPAGIVKMLLDRNIMFLQKAPRNAKVGAIIGVVERTAEVLSIPFTVGGGIRNIEDVRDLLVAGADKVSINTAAVERPELVKEASDMFDVRFSMRSGCDRRKEEVEG